MTLPIWKTPVLEKKIKKKKKQKNVEQVIFLLQAIYSDLVQLVVLDE